ncbi:hypothetical protein DX130_14735 [Paenibacillus paeoniae]|uniref:Uncharacterized protein n=1 Tax=Paenibacillus paeoniae TaxID=2292705 RepID=A0A371PH02_9BACL|nr:hypothetical protein DX130_14735 [Paenibacillus paeoniae]
MLKKSRAVAGGYAGLSISPQSSVSYSIDNYASGETGQRKQGTIGAGSEALYGISSSERQLHLGENIMN